MRYEGDMIDNIVLGWQSRAAFLTSNRDSYNGFIKPMLSSMHARLLRFTCYVYLSYIHESPATCSSGFQAFILYGEGDFIRIRSMTARSSHGVPEMRRGWRG